MPVGTLRVAVVQLRCHPAISIGGVSLLQQPLLASDARPILGRAGKEDLLLYEAQKRCEASYSAWQGKRLDAVLEHLEGLEPKPGLVLLPEGSVPLELLGKLRDYARRNAATVLAGTHSIKMDRESLSRYRDLGATEARIQEWGTSSHAASAVLPIFAVDKSHFLRKSASSVFEMQEVRRAGAQLDLTDRSPITVRGNGHAYRLLPLVCAEGMQATVDPTKCDLVAIIAFAPRQEYFDPLISSAVRARCPVALANDGAFGGSCIVVQADERMPQFWWGSPNNGKLPSGDGVVVADLDWSALAPQVGVTQPKRGLHLIRLASVAYELDRGTALATCQALAELRLPATTVEDIVRRLELMVNSRPDPLQLTRCVELLRMARNGVRALDWWDALGCDVMARGLSGLDGMEAQLAASFLPDLDDMVARCTDSPNDVLAEVVRAQARCRKAAAGQDVRIERRRAEAPGSGGVIDRTDDMERVKEAIDDTATTVLVVSGLPGVGKTAMLQEALRQAGVGSYVRIALEAGVTADGLSTMLLAEFAAGGASGRSTPTEAWISDASAVPKRASVVVFEGAHHLVEQAEWRDANLLGVVVALARRAIDVGAKVILEGERSIEIEGVHSGRIARMRVQGLPEDDAVQLCDKHLRRAGLVAVHYGTTDKRRLVRAVGGHPGAVILAAECLGGATMEDLLESLEGRRSHYREIVRRLLGDLDLSKEEDLVLGVLALARVPVPISALAGVIPGNPAEIVFKLYERALVERGARDYISLPALLIGFGRLHEPPAEQARKFHEAVAVEFKRVSAARQTADEVRWAIESSYHALLAERPELGVDLGPLQDASLAQLKRLVEREAWEAAATLGEVMLRTSQSPEVLQLTAVATAHCGDGRSALERAKEAQRRQSTRTWVLGEVGRIALTKHQTEVAEDALRLLRGLGRDSSWVAVLEGKIALRRGESAAAIESFRRANTLAERDSWPAFYLGRELLRNGAVNEAREVLEAREAREVDRDSPNGRVLAALRSQLVIVALIEEDLVQAKMWISRLADADPNSPELARVSAFVRGREGDAQAISKALEELDPRRARGRQERAQIHLFRGLFLSGAGHRDSASEEFSQAHQTDPQNVFVLTRWAWMLLELAREELAQESHEAADACVRRAKELADKVTALDDDNEEALRVLERIATEWGLT